MSTEIIGLDEITASQAAKEVTHNTGLRQLEGRLVRVKSRTTTAQPGSPAAGDTYILPASATGTDWATFTAKQLVHYYGGSWKAWTPVEGTRVWVNDEDSVWVYNGTDWVLDTRAPMLSKSVAGAIDVTLTEIESRYQSIDLTGAITASINVIVTTTPKLLLVKNSTTGAFTVTVKTSAGTGIAVAQGARTMLYCDGTNVVGSSLGTVNTADIADDAVTYAKIQNVSATDKVLGRSTAGAGDVEEIACTAAGRALIDDADATAQRATLAAAGTAVANTFTADQTITSTDAGVLGPKLYIYHNSASPAANDAIGVITFDGNNSSAALISYAQQRIQILDPTAASEDGQIGWTTYVAGSSAFRMYLGHGLYSPSATGGDKGSNSANFKDVYDDNVLLTCYAIDAYRNGSVDVTFWDSTALDLDVPAIPEQIENRPVTRKVMRIQRVRDGARIVETLVEVDEPVYDELPVFDASGLPVKGADGKPLMDRVQRMDRVVTMPAQPARNEVRAHGPAARFALRADELLDPKLYGASWKATGHLPAMPSPAEWEASGKKMALGDIQQRLWETVEVQAIHIDKLLAQIEALAARVTAMGG